MWGVNSSQSSYTSGEYTDFKMTSYDNQDKFYLPWNMITSELRHDMRLFISMLQREPWAYKITKVDNTTPKGIITYTVKQDRYNQEHDYVQLESSAPDYGDMYADYYTSNVEADANDNFNCRSESYNKYTLAIESVNDKIKIGATKVLLAKVYDGENHDITELYKDAKCDWNFNGIEPALIDNAQSWLDEYYDDNGALKYRFKCKFKFIGNEHYLNTNVNVVCRVEDLSSDITLDIVAL